MGERNLRKRRQFLSMQAQIALRNLARAAGEIGSASAAFDAYNGAKAILPMVRVAFVLACVVSGF
jgi:hypothetical protein